MNENQVVTQALEQLNDQTGLFGRWKPLAKEIDGELNLNFDTKTLHFFTEVKNELRQYQLPQLYEIAERYQPFMIIADHIFPKLKEILRDKKIGYLDTAGNIYFNTGDAFLWIDGKKAIEKT